MAIFLPLPGYADWPEEEEEEEERPDAPAATPDMWTLEGEERLPTIPDIREGVSANAWIVQAPSRSIDPRPHRGPKRLPGFARS
jgi:hypothetical protein